MKGRLLAVLDLAIDDFNTMRAKEGGRLAEDILGRADTIERLLGEVEERSPQTVTDDGHHPLSGHHIAKSNIDQLHVRHSRFWTCSRIFSIFGGGGGALPPDGERLPGPAGG